MEVHERCLTESGLWTGCCAVAGNDMTWSKIEKALVGDFCGHCKYDLLKFYEKTLDISKIPGGVWVLGCCRGCSCWT